MRAARLGLASSLLLALIGSAVAVARTTALPPNRREAALAVTSAVTAPATPPPVACHDAPAATQAPGGPVLSLHTAAAPPAAAPVARPVTTSATAAPPTTAPPAVSGDGCTPTAEQIAAAQKLISDTRSAITARYERAPDAVVDDYKPNTNDESGKTRVWHYTNDHDAHDGRILDPAHPEGLLYGRTDHHGLVLIGAFYLMEDPNVHGPEIGGCLTRWHVHKAGAVEMLHVWIVDMPGGPFAEAPDPSYIASL